VHEAANDNTNPYRNMVMDAMRMNQGFFICWKILTNHYGMAARTTVNYRP
jgi:hypothetical protein